MKRSPILALIAVLVGLVLTGCDEPAPVQRPTQPAVLTGADLPALVGEHPGDIVAFKFQRSTKAPRWVQVPVQIDERALVPFGTHPSSNSSTGVTGTVYGNGSGGAAVLQYTDADTFVGADPDPTFDADDELVFMIDDTGSRPTAEEAHDPAGVVPGSGVEVSVTDPDQPDTSSWLYLYVSDGTLEPSAGRDYVDYDFNLVSGGYRATYRRASGPNPEMSSVTTRSYRIGYTDRWFETEWRIGAGPNLIDGLKNMFVVGQCGRSNRTFADGEGAFVANIDGPVRAIRSYIGANSGPKTQRTHLMYRDHEEIITDLRVHAIPAIVDLVDYGVAAHDMTYRNSANPGGVTIDGVADTISTAVADWEAVHGPQGTVVTTSRIEMTVPGVTTTWWYADEAPSPVNQCWGDDGFRGASGPFVAGGIANTDPALGAHHHLRGIRTVNFLPPSTDGAGVNATAQLLADQVDRPVQLAAAPFDP